jgi:hypothetical protein
MLTVRIADASMKCMLFCAKSRYYLYRQGLVFFRMDYASTMALLFLYVVVLASGFALKPLLTRFALRAGER